MTLADYLASEAAREDVRKVNDRWPLYPFGDAWRWTIEMDGAWTKLSVWADGHPKRAEATVYYRPDGERYTVTDMGEGVGLARANPWASVRPIGRPRRGKPQLTLDEAGKLSKAAEAQGDEAQAILRRAEQRSVNR